MPKKAEDRTRIFQDPDFPNRYIIEHQGVMGTVAFWAERLGVSYTTLQRRLNLMPLEKALTPGRLYDHDNNQQLSWTYRGVPESLKPMEAPNPEDQGRWFTNVENEPVLYYKNAARTIKQWAAKKGFNVSTLKSRLLTQRLPIKLAMSNEIEHGTTRAYITLKCRCDVCKKGNAQRQREYQQRVRGDTEPGKPVKKKFKK
jgi:hypothetical protein